MVLEYLFSSAIVMPLAPAEEADTLPADLAVLAIDACPRRLGARNEPEEGANALALPASARRRTPLEVERPEGAST